MKGFFLLLALAACACSPSPPSERAEVDRAAPEDVTPDQARADGGIRTEFLKLVGHDPWLNWPADLSEDPADRGKFCFRVAEPMRQTAIDMLAARSAVPVDAAMYKRLVGTMRPPGGGTPYLLRGFSSENSFSRVRWSSRGIVVHTDPSGDLRNVRRHPCVAILNRAPGEVFTVAEYDL